MRYGEASHNGNGYARRVVWAQGEFRLFFVFFYILTDLNAINTQPPGRELAQKMGNDEIGNEVRGSECAPGNICTYPPPTFTAPSLTSRRDDPVNAGRSREKLGLVELLFVALTVF